MADVTAGRRVIVAAAGMILAAQILAIATDVVAHQNDPSDIVLLFVLIALTFLMVRRVRWARWVTVVLITAGGLLELLGMPLVIATRVAPGFWLAVDRAVPALQSVHTTVVTLAAGPAFALLVGTLAVEAVLDLVAVGLLVFAPSVRAYFKRDVPGVTA